MGLLSRGGMRRQLTKLLAGTVVALVGCGQSSVSQVTLQEKLLSRPNPTSYEFDATVNEVKAAIRTAFDKRRDEEAKKNRNRVWRGGGDAEDKRILTMLLQLPPGFLFWKGDADSLAKNLLTKPGNENDAYFYGTDSPVGESLVHFRDGQPLIYFADFHIHLTSVGPQKTRVEIITYDSSVNTGVRAPWSPARGRTFIYVKVDKTTVEEYQILLGIAEQLGVKDMPKCVIPGPDSPVRQLTRASLTSL